MRRSRQHSPSNHGATERTTAVADDGRGQRPRVKYEYLSLATRPARSCPLPAQTHDRKPWGCERGDERGSEHPCEYRHEPPHARHPQRRLLLHELPRQLLRQLLRDRPDETWIRREQLGQASVCPALDRHREIFLPGRARKMPLQQGGRDRIVLLSDVQQIGARHSSSTGNNLHSDIATSRCRAVDGASRVDAIHGKLMPRQLIV
jgi:hypothetical protein